MLRTANISDLESVTNLAMALWSSHEFLELQDEMEALLVKRDAVIVLYFENSEPIGFAQCQLRYDYVEGTESSPVGYLEGVFVEEVYRRRGVAKQLLKYCERWAKEKGCREFASDCELTNRESLYFHLKLGFIEANRIICFKKDLREE